MQVLSQSGQESGSGDEHVRAVTKMCRSKSTVAVSFPILEHAAHADSGDFVLKFPEKGLVESAAAEADWFKTTGKFVRHQENSEVNVRPVHFSNRKTAVSYVSSLFLIISTILCS
jgi:hypothetical protein